MPLRVIVLAIVPFCVACLAQTATNPPSAEESATNAVVGQYVLIGRRPDSEVTYTGRVTIENKPRGLEYTRSVEGDGVAHGPVIIDAGTSSSAPAVLRMTFPVGADVCTVAYRYQKNATGLAWLSGYVHFHPPKQTHVAGLEALFPLKEVRIE